MDKIVCLGKNYAEHIKELGDSVTAEKPVVFIKPPSVLVSAQKTEERVSARIPQNRGEVHHECELVLKISKNGYQIPKNKVREYVSQFTVGLDMTLRDEQAIQKKKGHPWTTSKVFPDSAIVGPWCDLKWLDEWQNQPFTFSLQGQTRQSGLISQMIHPWEECVSYASEFFELRSGDILFTGTPKGVGPVHPGETGELRWGKILFSVTWIPYKN